MGQNTQNLILYKDALYLQTSLATLVCQFLITAEKGRIIRLHKSKAQHSYTREKQYFCQVRSGVCSRKKEIALSTTGG